VQGIIALFRSAKYELTVVTDANTTLPELLLVALAGELPMDRDDGVIVHRIPENTCCSPDQPYSIRLAKARLPRNPRFGLFPADPKDGEWLELNQTA
jgi:hypothetical protein